MRLETFAIPAGLLEKILAPASARQCREQLWEAWWLGASFSSLGTDWHPFPSSEFAYFFKPFALQAELFHRTDVSGTGFLLLIPPLVWWSVVTVDPPNPESPGRVSRGCPETVGLWALCWQLTDLGAGLAPSELQ